MVNIRINYMPFIVSLLNSNAWRDGSIIRSPSKILAAVLFVVSLEVANAEVFSFTFASQPSIDKVQLVPDCDTLPSPRLWQDAVATRVHPRWPAIGTAVWISSSFLAGDDGSSVGGNTWRWFQKSLDLPGDADIVAAAVSLTADNFEEVWLNGVKVGSDGEMCDSISRDSGEWETIKVYDLMAAIVPGHNEMRVLVRNHRGSADPIENPTGLVYEGVIVYEGNPSSGGDIELDESPVPLLAIQDVSQLEGSEGVTRFEFSLEFERPLPGESWVDYDLLDGSATAGEDYVKGNVPLRWVFAQGTQFTNLTVLVIGDVQPESAENFFLSIEGASNILVTDTHVEGIILNDDINSPPVIDAIPDQSVAVGELLDAIGIAVSDIETGANDLEVILESLDPERLPNDLLTMSDDNSENRRFQIGAVTLPTLDDPIRIRVSVIDEHGASAVAEFNLAVTNDLPKVRISSPSNYSILPIPEGRSLLDISVEIEVADDQPVDEVFVSVDLVRLDGLVVPNPLLQNAFDFMWDDVSAGEYTLTATARDSATGDLVLSSPVYIKVVAGGGGEIAIVHPASENRDEIFTIWDYLVDLGHQPQVFLQDEISVELLESYRAVIWHDLGLLDLHDQTVSTLSALQDTKRMPTYFIGDRLASSGGDLSEESQNEWAELTKLTPTDERVTLSQVNFNPFRDSFQNQISGYWALVDGFALEGEVDETRAHEDAQVLAVSGENEIPVVLRYPATDVEAQVTARRFVQSFPVEEKGVDAATLARRVLFENALCYLLKGEECGCPSAAINLVIETELNVPISSSLGEAFEIKLKLGNNGRCDVRGGQLSFKLPEGLELSDVQSKRNFACRWDPEIRTAFIAVGILEDSPDETIVTLQLRSLLPGDYGLEIIASGNYFDPLAVPVTVKVEGAFLAIDRNGSGGVALQVFAWAIKSARVEWSAELGAGTRWQLLKEVQFPNGKMEAAVEVSELGQQRFYRVVGQ